MLRQAFQSSVYSTTAQDWRLTSELAIGEQVLTYAGRATLTGKRPAPAQRVYNLEVREVHNFLVAEVGVVVHNSCFNEVKELLKDFVTHKRVGGKSGAIRNGNKVDLPDGRSVPISAKEFPDFTGFTAKTSNGIPLDLFSCDYQIIKYFYAKNGLSYDLNRPSV